MKIEKVKQDKSMIVSSCDTNDLTQLVDTYATKSVMDDPLARYEMESLTFIKSELMKVIFVEDESQAKYDKAQWKKYSWMWTRIFYLLKTQKKAFMNILKKINRSRIMFPKIIFKPSEEFNMKRKG